MSEKGRYKDGVLDNLNCDDPCRDGYTYCPKTNRIYSAHEDLTQCGRYHYNFTPQGFVLLSKKNAPLYPQTQPLVDKIYAHLLWICLWLALSFFLPTIATTLITVHLFLIGLRLTPLLLYGGLLPTLFPPLYTRITRKLQKEPSLAVLKKHNLDSHPGILFNLGLALPPDEAKQIFYKAYALCPDHPFLSTLSER